MVSRPYFFGPISPSSSRIGTNGLFSQGAVGRRPVSDHSQRIQRIDLISFNPYNVLDVDWLTRHYTLSQLQVLS